MTLTNPGLDPNLTLTLTPTRAQTLPQARWLHVAFVAETPLLLLLLARAFPASELPVLPRDHDAEGDAAAGARSDESGDEATRLV